MNGYAATVFAYGQTGSGKTFTISGIEERISDETSGSQWDGLIPRSVRYAFERIAASQEGTTYSVRASFAEIYVTKIRNNGYRALRRPHRHAGFAVLKSPDIPSVLVELGFLSNPKDAKYLSNKKSRARVLKALTEAIVDYVKSRSKI